MKRHVPLLLTTLTAVALSACATGPLASASTGASAADSYEAYAAAPVATAGAEAQSAGQPAAAGTGGQSGSSGAGYLAEAAVRIALGAPTTVSGPGVTINGSTVTITDAGAYSLTGTLVAGLRAEESAFVAAHAPVAPEALEPKLWNDFHRITLVGVRRTERVTIDLGLSFEANARHTADLPGVVVAELKQHGVDRSSPFMHQMRAARVRPAGMSKYCVGVSLLHQAVKHSAFKPTLRTLEKLMKEETHVR
jgi:hypothetical protein